MAIDYVFNWSDESLKKPFKISAQAINTSATSLTLTGKGAVNWGESIQQNMIRLLEHFASNGKAPKSPTIGQLWFDTKDEHLKVFWDGRWNDVGYERIDSATPPTAPRYAGDFWYDTSVDLLKVWTNDSTWSTLNQEGMSSPTQPTSAPTPAPTPTPVTLAPTPTPTTQAPTPTPTPTTQAPTPTPSPIPTTPTSTTPYPLGQQSAEYVLTFEDPFDGRPIHWNPKLWYEPSSPINNYIVEDGIMKIWAYVDSNGTFIHKNLNTDGFFRQKYGFFEIRAKLPRGVGVWPAFWLYTDANNISKGGPYKPEINIMEAFPGGGLSSGWGDSNYHATAYQAAAIEGGPETVFAGYAKVTNIGNLSTSFNTYGMKWEPGRITWYFNGQEVYSCAAQIDQELFVVLSLLYGSASGTPSASATPTGKSNSLEIDYFRAWQLSGEVSNRYTGSMRAGTDGSGSTPVITGYNGNPRPSKKETYYGTISSSFVNVGQSNRYIRGIFATSNSSTGAYNVTLLLTQGDHSKGEPGLIKESIKTLKITSSVGTEVFYTSPQMDTKNCQFGQVIITNGDFNAAEGYTSWTWTISQSSISRFQHGQDYQIIIN